MSRINRFTNISNTSKLISQPVTVDHYYEIEDSLPDNVRFSTAVAGFGQILGGGLYTGEFGYEDVIELAKAAIGDDQFGYRNEFVRLVRSAEVAKSVD